MHHFYNILSIMYGVIRQRIEYVTCTDRLICLTIIILLLYHHRHHFAQTIKRTM